MHLLLLYPSIRFFDEVDINLRLFLCLLRGEHTRHGKYTMKQEVKITAHSLDDNEMLKGIIDRMLKTTEQASQAIDDAIVFVD